jgi:S-adenosylmethionine synthetase
MKVILTGATGLLGRAILELLKDLEMAAGEYEVVGTGFSRAIDDIAFLDLRDARAVKDFVKEQRPHAIIHAAAERRPDLSENDPDATRTLNVEATKSIAEAASEVGAWVIYISTDYVFDGTAPPYAPDASPNPLNFYGQSKLEGEEVVRAAGDHCVLRVPVLYGDSASFEESPITMIAKTLIDGEKATLDHWATRYPTMTLDVAAVCEQLLERKEHVVDFGGTYHFSGGEAMTKFEIAEAIAKACDLSADHLTPDPNPPVGAPRPQNSQLDCSSLTALGIGMRTPFDVGIRSVLGPFLS